MTIDVMNHVLINTMTLRLSRIAGYIQVRRIECESLRYFNRRLCIVDCVNSINCEFEFTICGRQLVVVMDQYMSIHTERLVFRSAWRMNTARFDLSPPTQQMTNIGKCLLKCTKRMVTQNIIIIIIIIIIIKCFYDTPLAE